MPVHPPNSSSTGGVLLLPAGGGTALLQQSDFAGSTPGGAQVGDLVGQLLVGFVSLRSVWPKAAHWALVGSAELAQGL